MTVKMLLAFKKYQQNFLGSAYYNSKIVFSHWKEKKKKIKKNPIIPKTLHGEVSNTKVW